MQLSEATVVTNRLHLTLRVTRRAKRIVLILLTGVVALQRSGGQQATQGLSVPALSAESYQEILDSVLGKPIVSGRGLVFSLSIRYLPASSAESQLSIVVWAGKTPQVDFAQASQSVFNRANAILAQRGDAGPGAMAREIGVRRGTVPLATGSAMDWKSGFLAAFAKRLSALDESSVAEYNTSQFSVILDATLYKVTYIQNGADITATFEGGLVGDWADGVKRDALIALASQR